MSLVKDDQDVFPLDCPPDVEQTYRRNSGYLKSARESPEAQSAARWSLTKRLARKVPNIFLSCHKVPTVPSALKHGPPTCHGCQP
jgi:hypothetical protein